MSRFAVNVQVYEGFEDAVSASTFRRIAAEALSVGEAAAGSGLSDVVASDDVVRELNRRHRGLDETTDVLSFSFSHGGEYLGDREPTAVDDDETAFVLPPGREPDLGEVAISYPQAKRQAEEAGHSVDREMAVLLVHGVLHLLGYDHEAPGEAETMKGLETRALSPVWIPG